MHKRIKHKIKLISCALVSMLAACSQLGQPGPSEETNDPNDAGSQLQVSDNTPKGNGETLEQQVSGAIADLTVRTGGSIQNVKVNQARMVTWASSALGCPKWGRSYTQALVPGVRVILEVDGKSYRYHGLSGSKLFFCPAERAKEPALGPGEEFM